MATLSEVEKRIILRIFKDLTIRYNSSSISSLIKVTRVGAYKSLKNLEKQSILKSEQLGKAFFYELNKNEEYAKKIIEVLLMEEGRAKLRWIDEFKELSKYTEVLVLFGSIIKNEEKANDIDLLIIMKEENNKIVSKIIELKNEMLTRKVHILKQTRNDFKSNILKKDKVLISAISNGIVLSGYEKYVEVMLDVSN